MWRETLYSLFPSKSLPRRIAPVAMHGRVDHATQPDAEDRPSHEKLPPRLVEATELNDEGQEAFADFSGTLSCHGVDRCAAAAVLHAERPVMATPSLGWQYGGAIRGAHRDPFRGPDGSMSRYRG